MSKKEGSIYSERLHILMVLGRISTSASSVKMFQHWQKSKNKAIYNHADSLIN